MKTFRILIVDDEPGLAGLLCRALSLVPGGACAGESACSAQSALARMAETCFDLLVTDLCMPGMDGLHLIDQARQICPNARSVLITAYSRPEIETSGLASADAYLAKPFSLGHFTQVVLDVLDQDARGDT